MLSMMNWYASAGPFSPMANNHSVKIGNSQQAARLVKNRVGGKILKVQRSTVNGNPGYKVKLLKDNGHVITVKVDAISGKLSGN